MRFENESAVSSLLLWENNRGKYVFFGLIIGFFNFPVASRTAGHLACAKTCP